MTTTINPYNVHAIDHFFRSKGACNNAREYVGQRDADTLKLCKDKELSFRAYPHGALLCNIYGHSIHLTGHTGGGAAGIFYRSGSAVPLLFDHIAQPLAFILKNNW